MKKIFSAASVLALAGALFMFSACGVVNNNGVIAGNYQEATDEEIVQVVRALQWNSLLGAEEGAEQFFFGLKQEANLEFSVQQGDDSLTAEANMNSQIALEFAGDPQEVSLRMSGEAEVSGEMKAAGSEYKGQISANQYLDQENLYLDANIEASGPTGASEKSLYGKIRYEELADLFRGDTWMPVQAKSDNISAAQNESFDIEDVAELRAQLEAMGVTLAVDTSKGIKVRLQASSTTVQELLEGLIDDLYVASSWSELNFTFPSTLLEAYIALNEDGKLLACSCRFDVEATISDPGFNFSELTGIFPDQDAPDITLKLKGKFVLETQGKDVSLPSDLDGYPDLNLTGILTGFIA